MFFSVLWMKYMLPKACGERKQYLISVLANSTQKQL